MSKKRTSSPEREQVKRAHTAMKVELEQTIARADAVLARLRKRVASTRSPLRLVKAN